VLGHNVDADFFFARDLIEEAAVSRAWFDDQVPICDVVELAHFVDTSL
jgi:hypothetical protein